MPSPKSSQAKPKKYRTLRVAQEDFPQEPPAPFHSWREGGAIPKYLQSLGFKLSLPFIIENTPSRGRVWTQKQEIKDDKDSSTR